MVKLELFALSSSDAVLGPTEDGGFYLIGLKKCPPGLLKDLPWSTTTTLTATEKRLRSRGFSVSVLEKWFDVDRPKDLRRLFYLVTRSEVSAPHTRRVFRARPDLSLRLFL